MAFFRRHLTTVVLSLLALVVLVVVVMDRGSVSTNEATLRKKNLLDAWRADDVAAVAIQRGGRGMRLVRAAENDAGQRLWQVEIDGVKHPAEEQVVDQYLGSLEFATTLRRVEPDSVNEKAMGLDAPRFTIDVDMGAQRFALAVGGPATSPEGAAYVRVKSAAGAPVSVVSRELVAALDAAPERFRSRSFVPYFSVDLETIALDGAGGARHFRRAPWSGSRLAGFRFDEGGPYAGVRLSATAIDKLLVALADLQAEEFLTEDAARGAGRPDVTITLTPREGTSKPRAVIEVGGACPNKPDAIVAVRKEPTAMAVCVPKAPLEALSLPAERFADMRLVGAPADEVTEVKLEARGALLEIARSGVEWHLRLPTDRRVDADTGRAFLGALIGVEGTAFVPSGEAAFEPIGSARILSLLSAESADAGEAERTEALSWGEAKGGRVLVRRAEDGAVLSVPADRIAAFAPSDLALRARKIADEHIAELRALRIESGGRTQKLTRGEDGSWTLVEPKGPGLAVDPALANDAAGALLSLTADRWVADKDDGSFGLERPRLTLTASIGDEDAGGVRAISLRVGAATDGGVFAVKEGDPAVFVASRALEAATDRWLLDRSALAVPLPDIAGATITAGKKKAILASRGSTFRLEGAAPGVDAAAVQDALADFVAEGAVSIGKPRPEQGFDKRLLEIDVETKSGAHVKLALGAGDTYRSTSIFYARRDGVDATYAVARARVRPLLDAVGIAE